MKQIKNKNFFDVIIVGAGPASTYLSIFLDKNINVLIIDKNEDILKKFLISGNGKANITNKCCFEDLLQNMVFGSKNFMYYAFKEHGPEEILSFLDSLKIDYKKKENSTKIHLLCSNLVFKNKIKNLIETKHNNIHYAFNQEVVCCFKEENNFVLKTTKEVFYANFLVLATGGISFSKYSKNSVKSYALAKSFGHSISRLFPMGFSLELKNQFPQFKDLTGISFQNVECSLFLNKKKILIEKNDLMITHNGLGGPLIRRVSGYFSYYNCDDISLNISLISKQELEKVINEIKKLNELFKQFNFFTKRFIQNFYDFFALNSLSDVKNFSKKLKEEIINYFCAIQLNFANLKLPFLFEPAINTGGGVNTKEIDPKTFESKKLSCLYVIGEMLDVNAKTGGFNLTVCFSSAKCCAVDISLKFLNKK